MGVYGRYVGHVVTNIGGVYENLKTPEQEGVIYTHLDEVAQKNSMRWLQKNVFDTPKWLIKKDILQNNELEILSESEEAGLYIVGSVDKRKVFVFGHPEYEKHTLEVEYRRDYDKGLPIEVPKNYYLDDDKDTFRHKLATVQEYKGNRAGRVKPINLQGVKDYLVLHHNAKIVTGIEADDKIAMRKWDGYKLTKSGSKDRIIACTFDKDDMSCAGWSFDFRKDKDGKPLMKEPLWIDGLGHLEWGTKKKKVVGHGRKFLYYQWVDEDVADNYKSRKLSKQRWSGKRSVELLGPCTTDEECVKAVASKFLEWYPEPTTYDSWRGVTLCKDWVEVAQEYLDLCRMLRWDGDKVGAEDLFKKYGVDTTIGRNKNDPS